MSNLPSSFDGDPNILDESIFRRIGRRMKEEPLLPVGAAVTCWALYNAQQSMRTGNSVKTNRFFRYRLYAQAFTLVAMVGGALYYKADRFKKKEFQKVIEKQKAQEKRDAWIRELEMRDQEDREWRAKLGRVKDLQKEEEERLAILESQQKRHSNIDDGRKAMEDARKTRMQENNLESITVEASKPKLDKPAPPTENAEQDPGSKEAYKSVLGETEAGGLLGVKRIKTFYEDKWKPALGFADEKENEGQRKVQKFEGSDQGGKENGKSQG